MPSRIVPGKKLLCKGISAKSRSERYHSRGLWAIKAKNGGKWPAPKPKAEVKSARTVVVKDTKNSGKRTVIRPRVARKFDGQTVRVRTHSKQKGVPKFRASIVPGRVCIVLAGQYEGRRVVILKKLPSGLVIVIGPTSLNQVPLRRISPAYLIATSVKVDLVAATATKILEDNKDHINDTLFEKESRRVKRSQPTAEQRKARAEKRTEAAEGGARKQKVLLKTPRTNNSLPAKLRRTSKREDKVSERQVQKLKIQRALDYVLVKEVKKTPFLKDYFRGRFELTTGQFPHKLKF
jgi:large subunit ribosomal protein L6e